MRKFLILLGMLVCAMCAASAETADAQLLAQGACGDATNWAFYADGTLVISGEGSTWDCLNTDTDEVGWRTLYKHQITRVVVEDGVRRLGDWVLSECSQLSEVDFGSTMQQMGYGVFYRCKALEHVDLPESIVSVQGFEESGLREIDIPAGVVGLGGFRNCEYLESVYIHAVQDEWAAYSVECGLFSGCTSLKEIQVEEGHPVLHVTDGVLYSGTRLISYPPAKEAVAFCPEEGTTEITQLSISGALYLETVTFPDSVQIIGGSAFRNCPRLASVELPAGLEQMYDCVFEYCPVLKTVKFNSSISETYGFVFANCPSLERIDLPSGLTFIGNHAFYAGSSLISVVIPSTVTTIDAGAFRGTSLEVVYLPPSVQEIRENVFADTPLKAVVCEEGSYAATWAQENGITAICLSADGDRQTLPAELLTVEDSAFFDTAITYLIVPEGCERIEDGAFANCEKLRVIELPDSIMFIADDAFKGCEDFVIRTGADSEAAKWARANGIAVWVRP